MAFYLVNICRKVDKFICEKTRSTVTKLGSPGSVQSINQSNFRKTMNTLQDSTNKDANGRKLNIIGNEQALMEQFEIIKQFFQTDDACEIIESLHVMVENFLL
jgi:hypothetical protein